MEGERRCNYQGKVREREVHKRLLAVACSILGRCRGGENQGKVRRGEGREGRCNHQGKVRRKVVVTHTHARQGKVRRERGEAKG